MWTSKILLVCAFVIGCARLSPVLSAANDALGALCDARDTLGHLTAANAQLERGDVCAARALIQSHLLKAGADPEVAAVLTLIDSQVSCKG